MAVAKVSSKLRELYIRFKPKLITIGLWLLWFLALVFLATGVSFLVEGDSWGGFICFAAALVANIFLLRRKRKVLHFFGILLLFTFVSSVIGTVGYRFGHIGEDGALNLGITIFLSLVPLNLLTKGKWARKIGAVLLATVILLDLIFIVAPKAWGSEVAVGLLIGIMTLGVGIFLVLRKEIIARLSGVAVVVLALAAVAFSFVTDTGLVPMTGADKEIVLSKTTAQIDNLLEGWNETSYEKFTADFDSSLKEQLTETNFSSFRESWGEYISKGDPDVYGRNGFAKRVIYIAVFSQQPSAEIAFDFLESAGEFADRWKLIGLSFSPVEAKTPTEGTSQ